MNIKLLEEPFNPWEIIQQEQDTLPTGSYGATTVFIGTMRDFNDDQQVSKMTLEHYPGMTEKELEKINVELEKKWAIDHSLIAHRVGDVFPNDPIVVVAVWSARRKDAYEANRYIMEALKTNAPFWKKELTEQGEVWVEKNSPGY